MELKIPFDGDESLEPKRSAVNEEEEEEPACLLLSISYTFFFWSNQLNYPSNRTNQLKKKKKKHKRFAEKINPKGKQQCTWRSHSKWEGMYLRLSQYQIYIHKVGIRSAAHVPIIIIIITEKKRKKGVLFYDYILW